MVDATVYQYKVSKEQLEEVPEAARVFYFFAGQLTNEINILTKLLLYAKNGITGKNPVVDRANIAQYLLLIKLLAGKLYEGKYIIGEYFSKHKLHEVYKDELGDLALDSLKKINKYFGSSNIIEKFRNDFAFHFGYADEIKAVFEGLQKDFSFIDYLSSKHRGHNLFYSAEEISLHSLIAVSKKENFEQAMLSVFVETIEMAHFFGDFLERYIGIIIRQATKQPLDISSEREIVIRDQPLASSLSLSFFSLPDDTA